MSVTAGGRAEVPIMLLIEESSGMARRWGRDPRTKAVGVALLVNGFLGRLPDDPGILVALIGYAEGPSGRPDVGPRWGGPLARSDFVPVPRLHQAPRSVEARTTRHKAADGTVTERTESVPLWYAPGAGGEGRPQSSAFRACEERLGALEARGRALSAPVVVHVTTGDPTDGDPGPSVARLLSRPSSSGAPLVLHAHLASSRVAAPLCYPPDPAGSAPPEARALAALAGPLGEEWHAAAELAGVATGAGPSGRGVVFDATGAEILKLLKVVEALARSRRGGASAPRVQPRSGPPAGAESPHAVPTLAPEVDATPVPAVPAEVAPGAAAVPPAPAPAPAPRTRETRLLWTFPPAAVRGTTRPPLRNAVVVGPGGTVLACLQNRLVALTPDGAGLWWYQTGGHIPGAPALGPDGLVRVHSDDGLLHAVGPDGARGWPPVEVGRPLGRATPVVDDDGNTWVCVSTGGLVGVDARGRPLEPRPFYRSDCLLNSTGLVRDGILYVGGDDHCVHAVALAGPRGRNLWDHDAGRGRTGWYITAALALGPGPTVIAASHDDHLYAFRLDGTVAWRAALPGLARGSPVVGPDGRVALGVGRPRAGGEAGALVRVDPATGAVAVVAAADEPVETTPAIGDDGVVYFGDNVGIVRAVAPSGALAWEFAAGAPVRSTGAVVAPGVVVFGLEDGTLVALRGSSQGPARAGRALPEG
jgi:outer membrane protein assembly factor BamB